MMVARVKRLAPLLILLAVAIVLYRKAIRLWWTLDDPATLQAILTRAWDEAFASSRPVLLLMQELLLRFLGVDPDPWYRVQLALIVLVAIALLAVLRLFVDTAAATVGALLVLSAPVICTVSTQLRTMHLLIAILFAAAAFALYEIAFRRRSFALEVLSAACYFLAMLAHSAAIPLPLLLFFLPDRRLRVRVVHLMPHVGALLGFLLWRQAAWPAVSESTLVAITGDAVFLGIITIALFLPGVVRVFATARGTTLALAGLAASALSVLVSGEALPVWIWLASTFAIGAASLSISPRVALFVVALATTLVANRQEWSTQYVRAKQMSEEARVFLRLDGASLLRKPSIPPSTMNDLRWLKERHFGLAIGTGWFFDDFYLCHHLLRGRQVHEWNEPMKQVVEVTARMPDFAAAYCSKIREDVPLWAEFHQRGGMLTWRLGPHAEGRYSLVLDDGVQAFEVDRESRRPLADVAGATLRIRYDAPAGWVTYSPEITLDFARQSDFTWHR